MAKGLIFVAYGFAHSFSHKVIYSGLSQANFDSRTRKILYGHLSAQQIYVLLFCHPFVTIGVLIFSSLPKLRTYLCRYKHSAPGTRPRNVCV